MLNFTPLQEDILGSLKGIYWLFDVTESDGTEHHWSHIAKENTYGVLMEEGAVIEEGVVMESTTVTYTADVIEFDGIRLAATGQVFGQIAPNTADFEVVNPDGALAPEDFDDAEVLIRLVGSDGVNVKELAAWGFDVPVGGCVGEYQRLSFSCVDFLQKYLDGVYPNTALVSALSPEYSSDGLDGVCVPVMFGIPYFPLKPIYITDQRYYLLGLASDNYKVYSVSSPEGFENAEEYDSEFMVGSFEFPQSTHVINGVAYRVVQPIILDSTGNGVPDSCGLWKSGDLFLDAPFRVGAGSTSGKTNPAYQIQAILEGFGIDPTKIDAGGTFGDAGDLYDTWGLEFHNGLNKKLDRRRLLSWLLSCCNSCLRVTDKIELHPIVKASQKTFNSSLIVKDVVVMDVDGDMMESYVSGEGSFRAGSSMAQSEQDSGYVRFYGSAKPVHKGVTAIVKPDGTSDDISSEVIEIPEGDNQVAARLAELYFIQKLFRKGSVSFDSFPSAMRVQPDDVITVSGDNYGGEYDVLVSSVHIEKLLTVRFSGVRYSVALEDFGDSVPDALSVATDDTTLFFSTESRLNNDIPFDVSSPNTQLKSSKAGGAYAGFGAVNGAEGDYEASVFAYADDETNFVNNYAAVELLAKTAAMTNTRVFLVVDSSGNYFLAPADSEGPNPGTSITATDSGWITGTDFGCWDTVFADDFTNVADFLWMDEVEDPKTGMKIQIDDLQALRNIRPRAEVDQVTGFRKINDSSIPPWLAFKWKRDIDVRNSDGDVIERHRKGDVAFTRDGKICLSFKAMMSFIMGVCRQLDREVMANRARIEKLEKGIN